MSLPQHSSPDSAALGDLFHAAFRGLRRTWSSQLAPFELTPHQWRALHVLAGGHGRPQGRGQAEALRLNEVAERLRIAPRSATEVVDQLEAKGLAARRPDPRDRRATQVLLTGEGEELLERVLAVRRQESGRFFGRLGADEQAQLARLLGILADDGDIPGDERPR